MNADSTEAAFGRLVIDESNVGLITSARAGKAQAQMTTRPMQKLWVDRIYSLPFSLTKKRWDAILLHDWISHVNKKGGADEG